jgi:hypothetical protein
MAVIKAKPRKNVEFFLALLQRELVTPYVVTVVGGDAFKGAKGDTVNLRIPGLKAKARDYEWRTRTAPIVLDDIEGVASIPIKLNKHVYSATGLTDEHMTMDEIQFAAEVLAPQVAAVTDDFEAKVVAGLRAANVKHTLPIDLDDAQDPHLTAVEANRLMDSDKVAPSAGRTFLVGSDVAAAWIASDRLSKYDSTGETGTPALRRHVIGLLGGHPVVVHNGLNANEGYLLHKTGLIMGNIAPVVPQGATAGATGISRNGFSVRWIQDYDPNYLRDRSVVSSFLGVNDFRDERNADGTWIYEESDLEEDEVPTGVTPVADGTRKNVRIVKFAVTGNGSVLPA